MNPPDYIFCGAAWPILPVERYVLWSKYYHALFPDTQLVIFHDGPNANLWSESSALVKYLTPHLGRPSHLDHAGFFRSFLQIPEYLYKSKKVIWIDWDFMIVTQRFLDWICDITTGWRTVWCPQFDFPESSLQIICADQLESFKLFRQRWIATAKNVEIERHIPFTEINRNYIGGRYSDKAEPVPANADYVAQTSNIIAKSCYDTLNVTA